MADAFSVAASGLALIQLSAKVCELCYYYYDAVKGSQQDFKKLGDEIKSIHQQLEEIRILAAGDDESNPQYPSLLEWTKNESLKDYKAALEELKERLDVPGWRKSSRKLLWPFRKPKMECYLSLVEEQRLKLQLLLTTATTKTVTKVLRKLDERELQKVRKWLNVVDPGANFSSALALREPGTGSWLLRGHEYIDWKEGRGGVLWLHGIPGCGKSVLSATAIEDVKNLCDTNDDYALAYFYFTFSDSEKQNLLNMLLSIVGQLLEGISDRGFPDEVMNLYQNSKEIGKSTDIKALKYAFSQMIRLSKRTFIIFDALDEFARDTREGLLSWIRELTVDHSAGSLSILVTSRPEADIVRSLEPLATFAISLQSETINPDIRAFIQNSLDYKDSFKKFTEEIKGEIEDTLIAHSQGMFRWVVCLLRTLEDCIAPKDVRAALKKLPKDLDSVYSRILEGIPEAQREYMQRVMHWLTFSAEPLTLGQLAEAAQIEYVVDKYGEDSEPLFDNKSLVSICPSLICFEDSRDDKSHPRESCRLRLAHFSVKEYLISDRASQGPSAYYHISEDKANLLMGHACLSRILRHSEQGTIRGNRVEETSFLYHSARYWFVYFRSIEVTAPLPLSNAALKVLKLGRGWLDIYDPDRPWRREFQDSGDYPPAIYYSSLINLVMACELLVNRREDVVTLNYQGGCYGNALQAAATQGNESVVRLLLENGAEVNAQGGRYGNALQAAVTQGNESVVRLLLERGAQVNAQGGHYGNALQAAVTQGNEPVVQVLLKCGAEVNAPSAEYGDPLQAAAFQGNESVVRLLLEHGAEADIQGGHYGNALQAAAYRGNESVIQLLLECGAEVNAQGGRYDNALQAAAYRGNGSVVQLLLERGAEPNIQGGYFGNALQVAAADGNVSVVQLLLERGAEVNSQGGHYGNALQAAAVRGNEPVVRLLLEHGADVNAPGGYYVNAIQAAARGGNEPVVRLLLERGAEVNAHGGDYCNALKAAKTLRHESMARLLLTHGAYPNAMTSTT
ncbi:unnamed protein product [Tuber aestivum]|uniref:NACHT domain-containing protein n=1 Tax=Tuber aestivum TaxID=59557 RepID=A0A292Q914_9PEZI|nr:unnamed protein product [Tuber aestivum]